jgi:hypothetical protein
VILNVNSISYNFDYKNFYEERKQKEYKNKIPDSLIALCIVACVLMFALGVAIKLGTLIVYSVVLTVFLIFCLVFYIFLADMLKINKTTRDNHVEFQQKQNLLGEKIELQERNKIQDIKLNSVDEIDKRLAGNQKIFDENNKLLEKLKTHEVLDKHVNKYEYHNHKLKTYNTKIPSINQDEIKQKLFNNLLLRFKIDELHSKTDLNFSKFLYQFEVFWRLLIQRIKANFLRIIHGKISPRGITLDLEKGIVFGSRIGLDLNSLGENIGIYSVLKTVGDREAIVYIHSNNIQNPFAKSYIIYSNDYGEYTIIIFAPGGEMQIENILTTHAEYLESSIFYQYSPEQKLPGLFLIKNFGPVADLPGIFPITIKNEKLTLDLSDFSLYLSGTDEQLIVKK